MRTEYLKYKDYKKIDHILLEGMPTGWELKKIKFVGNVKMGQSPKSEDCNKLGNGIPFLQGNADFGVISPTATTYCETANKVSLDGDILFSVRAPVGALNISDKQYGIGRGLCSLTASNIQSRFLWFALQVYRLELKSLATGSTYDAISIDEVSNIKILVPSTHEQTQIANFLDQKTGQIDKLINEKEKLLKLLAEKRTAIITQAVTKGLDPNVEMQDSGIDWLGEIPKSWEVKPLKFTVKLINDKLDELGELPYLGLEHIESWTSKRIVDEKAKADGVVSRFKSEDILFGKLRPYLAKVYKAEFEGGASTEALVLRCGDEVIPEFLKFFLVSDLLIDVINSSTYGSKMPRASWNFIGKLPMLLPKKETQLEIVNWLSDKLDKFDNSISKIRGSINQLKEYREALITAAVTGQIDVRKEAAL